MDKNWKWTKSNLQESIPGALAQSNPMQAMPFSGSLSSMYQEMDRMFNQTMRSFGMPAWGSTMNPMLMPKVDIASTGREYLIEVEVPGMSENDIRINLTRDGQLCICGEKRLENENQDKDFHRIERAYGSFSRTLALPEDADVEAIRADFHNGVLTISAPRMESPNQGRRIEIGGGEAGRMRGKQHPPRQDNRPDNGPAQSGSKRAA